MLTVAQVAATIDHAALKPAMTDEDIKHACDIGKRYGVATVCVRPSDVRLAAAELEGSSVGLSAVVGFPHGGTLTSVKAFEAEKLVELGAVELDMVMNIGRFLSGDFASVERDIAEVVRIAHERSALVKVIFEVCYHTDAQIADACRLSEQAGADFVKTSTGFAEGAATPEAVQIMLDTVGDRLGVKAAGGIRTFEAAVGYLEQGCTRLGIGSTETVLSGAEAEGSY